MPDLREITALVLAGGMGTRLRSVVADRPKVLAEVSGRPFICQLLDQLTRTGCRRIVLGNAAFLAELGIDGGKEHPAE